MKKYYDSMIMKETLVIVSTGTIINYPISILFTWLLLDVWGITNPVAFATITTIGFYIIAFFRVYVVRYLAERHKLKMKT